MERPFVIPTTEGWLLLSSTKPSGLYVAALSPEGALTSDPAIVDKDLVFPKGFQDAVPFGEGAAILGSLDGTGPSILFLASGGKVSQIWQADLPHGSGSGDLVEHQGGLFWIYPSGPGPQKPLTNQVLIRKLQCVP